MEANGEAIVRSTRVPRAAIGASHRLLQQRATDPVPSCAPDRGQPAPFIAHGLREDVGFSEEQIPREMDHLKESVRPGADVDGVAA